MHITLSLTGKGNTVITKILDGIPVVEHYLDGAATDEETEALLVDKVEEIARIVKEKEEENGTSSR